MHLIVLVTASDVNEAQRIANTLLERRLAACVNIVPGVQSLFWWEGRVDGAEEALMLVKSRIDLLEELMETVKKLHSYQVPEIVAVTIHGGSKDYLKWLDSTLRMERASKG